MTSHELVNFLLAHSVEILKLVESRKFFYVQSVRCYHVGFTFEQMFGLKTGDVRDSCEHVTEMRGSAFHAVSVIDLPFSSLFIHIKLQEKK